MKKSFVTVPAILLCIGYGVFSWDMVTHSEQIKPEDSKYGVLCSTTNIVGDGLPITTYDDCCIQYNEAMDAVQRDWETNLQQLVSQERPASEMVEDGYESLRTYNCWLEYICRAVEYSGHAPIESVLGTGLKEEHLGTVPGCQSPDNLRMESEYNYFNTGLKDVPIYGLSIAKIEDLAGDVADGVADTFEDFYTENKLNFLPGCMTDQLNNENPKLEDVNTNYEACKAALEMRFGCPPGLEKALCPELSTAFTTLDSALKKRQGDQKAAALEKKLGTIVPKMNTMEMHVGYLSNFLQQLDARWACYAGKCS